MKQHKLHSQRLWGSRTGRLIVVLALLYALVVLGWIFIPWGAGVIHYALVWNLFLAALPLAFALAIQRREQAGKHPLPTALLLLFWLFFYPNAPYLITDFLHMDEHTFWAPGYGFLPDVLSWAGLMHITVGILAGCTCGMLSLYLIHRLVKIRLGFAAGWVFVIVVSFAGGIGIYLGRFIRMNTWDLVTRPWSVIGQVIGRIDRDTLVLYLLFAMMTFIPYAVFYTAFAEE